MNPETNAQFQVIIEPMQAHINNGNKLEKNFGDIYKSIFYFMEVIDQQNCPITEKEEEHEMQAGGIGHDYRITWRRITRN